MPQGHVAIASAAYGDPVSGLVFAFRLGGGSDCYLYQLWGSLSGGPQPYAMGVANGMNFVRQSRTQLFVPGEVYRQSAGGSVVTDPGSELFRFDNCMAAWNLKQSGNGAVVTPVAIQYRVPKLIPQGLLNVAIFSFTYATYGGSPSPDPQQCIDTEVNLTFDWETTPPPFDSNPVSPQQQTVVLEPAPGVVTQMATLSVRQR
jgi:hypothetical protein